MFWVQQNICSFYVHAKNIHAQKLQSCILVKQYQVCRVIFYRAVCNEIHRHAKFTNEHFRLCVLAAYAAHVVAALSILLMSPVSKALLIASEAAIFFCALSLLPEVLSVLLSHEVKMQIKPANAAKKIAFMICFFG